MNIRFYLCQSNRNPHHTEQCRLSRSCALPEGCHIGWRRCGEPLTCCTVPLGKKNAITYHNSAQIMGNTEVYTVFMEQFEAQTCTCGCEAIPLSRGQAAHCGFSHQGVAFLAGKVTTRTEGEGLQGVHTCHVARKWKQNGGALFYCNRTIDDNHKHEKSTWNCVT